VKGKGATDGKPDPAMFRDSANAAWLSLMYADMPGVDEMKQGLARCFAKQNIDFILGSNEVTIGNGRPGVSFQVGIGCDQRCPGLSTTLLLAAAAVNDAAAARCTC
jgi:hypothetical protein